MGLCRGLGDVEQSGGEGVRDWDRVHGRSVYEGVSWRGKREVGQRAARGESGAERVRVGDVK